MSKLKSYTVSVGITNVFNFDVAAPDPDTAITLAEADWSSNGKSNWTPCPQTKPHFQVEEEREIPAEHTNSYVVSFYVTDRLDATIQATTEEEALRIAEALRDNNGTYEGSFDVMDTESTEMEIREVVS